MTKKRSIVELNAGSMADIAFLLLIFFLLVSVIPEINQGLLCALPPQSDDPPINALDRNVLEVSIRSDGTLLIENRESDMEGLQHAVKDFYCNSGMFGEKRALPQYPLREWITFEEMRSLPETESEKRTMARNLDLLGEHRVLPSSAVIYMSTEKGCSYSDYIVVMDDIDWVLNTLRDSVAMLKFGVSMEVLRQREMIEEINSMKRLLPKRVVESDLAQ